MNDSKATALQITQLVLYALGFAGMLGALFYVTYYPPAKGGEGLSVYLFGALSTVGGVILGHKRATRGRAVPPPADKLQGGFVFLEVMLALAAVAVSLALLGCAGLNAQGVVTITYNTPATLTSATLSPGGLAGLLGAPAPLTLPPAAAASAPK